MLRNDTSNRWFTKEEAEAKLGKQVRLTRAFPELEVGTSGRVMQIDEIEIGEFELIVEWDVLINDKIQHDWFTREGYALSLREVVL